MASSKRGKGQGSGKDSSSSSSFSDEPGTSPEIPSSRPPQAASEPERSPKPLEGLSAKPKAESKAEPKPKPKPKVQSITDQPLVTAKRAFAGRQREPIVSAFLHVEKLHHKTRKMTRQQWRDELDAFTKAPRG